MTARYTHATMKRITSVLALVLVLILSVLMLTSCGSSGGSSSSSDPGSSLSGNTKKAYQYITKSSEFRNAKSVTFGSGSIQGSVLYATIGYKTKSGSTVTGFYKITSSGSTTKMVSTA